MRAWMALLLLVGCGATVHAPPPPGVHVWDSHVDRQITEGETRLDVDPDDAYAAAVDYARWRSIFPDITQVEVTRREGVDARVTLVHRAGNRDNIHFHNRPDGRVVWFEDTGGVAEVWAEIQFVPGDAPGTTRVHSRLFADVHGMASLFVTDAKLRSLREQRITDDLVHLQSYFARRAAR
jgi:carbon monoxide dehydrogenase subunit G